MNPDQIPQLLKTISYADRRILPSDTAEVVGMVAMWAGVLADVPYEFAVQAVQQHYARTHWSVAPSDIATAWTTARRARVDRDTERTAPPVDPDDELAYRRALRGRRAAVAAGDQPPAAVHALTAGIGRQIPAQMPDSVRTALAAALPSYHEAAAAHPELSVACPVPACRRPAGKPCRSPHGRDLRKGTHASRRDAYAARNATA